MQKWRIVLGGCTTVALLGTFASNMAFASSALPVAGSSAVRQGTAVQAPAPSSGILVQPAVSGVLPAVGAATGALVGGVGGIVSNLSGVLLPAVGPAVSGLTAPVDGLTQDISDLAGAPVLGALVSSLPALPDAGALLSDVNGLLNGVGAGAGR